MTLTDNEIDYVHWDDPNELVDRLRLLDASRRVRNNAHDNEILSIIEELPDFDTKLRKIRRIALPVDDDDAANKRYVLQNVQMLKIRQDEIKKKLDTLQVTINELKKVVGEVKDFMRVMEKKRKDRVLYLLHYIGPAAFDILCDRLDPQDPFKQLLDDLILGEFYEPQPLEIAKNFRFHQRRQEAGESVQQFAAALRKLCIHCRFGDYLKIALRNHDGTVGKKLRLQVAATQPTTQVDLIQAGKKPPRKSGVSSTAYGRKKPLVNNSSNIAYTRNNANRRFNKNQVASANYVKERKGSSIKCYKCGRSHLASQCTLSRDVRCSGCGTKGHLQKVCFKAKKHTNQLEDILQLEHPKYRTKFHCTLKVDNKQVRFEIDSGSAVTVINRHTARELFPHSTIHSTDLNLRAFCNTVVGIIGYITVRVKYDQVERELNIYITDINRKPLLGREWIRQLAVPGGVSDFLDCNAIEQANKDTQFKVESLLQKYKELRSTEWSKINDKELDELSRAGVFTKAETAEWATLIVPILKADRRVLFCRDYKATINPKLVVDEHPLPIINEIFAKLTGGEKFTKIDLRQAYLQLDVDSKSSEVLTLNTHRGLYKVNRLTYGIRTIENILQSLDGVAVFLDDIVITGETEIIHLQRLNAILQRLHNYNIRINLEKSGD
ncbi:PREDICTED: uncharacterized protein K02A2.6-like [Wasmannia auropunctata]|uniref:uncharacterized protein K02A2.6-like n=1 Tax=Wasmannia auropunctata TaxID=64793 RepID=UPI0005EFB68C|nr:PREDICTED: uncharacterized protein K02A2.6-like [Wasmannia auropunctata]